MPLLSNVFGFTHSVVSHVGHAVLRDLTCYYTYHEDVQRLADAAANQCTRGDGVWNDKPTVEKFCFSPNVEDSLDGAQSNEDNSTLHIVADDVTCDKESVTCRDKESDKCTSTGTVEIQNTSEITCIANSTNNLNLVEKEINQLNNENVLLDLNVIDKDTFTNISDDVENNCKSIASVQTFNLGLEVEENLQSKDDSEEISETRDVLKNDNDFIDEHIRIEKLLKQFDEVGENNTIFDGTKIEENSDTSSDCELGVWNFKIKNLKNQCSNLQNSEDTKHKKKLFEDKIINNKISRYINNTVLPQTPVTKPNLVENTTTLETRSTSYDCEKRPGAADEISSSLPNIYELKEPVLESNSLSKFTFITDNLLETYRASEGENDAASACSIDSWDSWFSFSKFLSTVRPKSPRNDANTYLDEMSYMSEHNETKDECDCTNTHCCLQVVDSDEDSTEDIVYNKKEITKDLLTCQQLCSVETGSEGDWLYRVNATNSLLKSMNTIKSEDVEVSIATVQDTDKNSFSESSSEDLANKFYIEQWLNYTEPYQYKKLLACGDIIY